MLKHLILLFVFFSSMSALNYDEAFGKLMNNVKNKMETFRADVTQEVKISDMSESRILTGTVAIKKPDKLLLIYTVPVKQNIISNGKTIWIYFKEQNQVIVQDVSEIKGKDNNIFQLQKYLEYLKSKYIGSLKEEKKYEGIEAVLLEFVPKGEVEDLSRITLWVDKKKWLPIASTVHIGEGNSITVKFSNIKTNETLDDSLFDFKIPEGTEKITSLLQ